MSAMSQSPTMTESDVCCNNLLKCLSMVVLAARFCETMATCSTAWMIGEIPCRAGNLLG